MGGYIRSRHNGKDRSVKVGHEIKQSTNQRGAIRGNSHGSRGSHLIPTGIEMYTCRGALQIQDWSPQSTPVASRNQSQTHSDATGLNYCGDWSWICNAPQVSAVADEPARRAASRQTCCKQRWPISVINLRPN